MSVLCYQKRSVFKSSARDNFNNYHSVNSFSVLTRKLIGQS